MPLTRCSHCGERTFTFAGWSDPGHCSGCGRPLGGGPIEIDAVLRARRHLPEYEATAGLSAGGRRSSMRSADERSADEPS